MDLPAELIEFVLLHADEGKLPHGSIHGCRHWMRVAQNGARLADEYGFPRFYTDLFALFHDCERQNEHDDPLHGHRAAFFFLRVCAVRESMSKSTHDCLERLGRYTHVLAAAMACHTVCDPGTINQTALGTFNDSYAMTIAKCCLDADRLDIWRAGDRGGVDPHYLFSDKAKRIVGEEYDAGFPPGVVA